jgi:hypothetical protein
MNEQIAAMEQGRDALREACGARCNSEYNPCWYYEVADRLDAAIEQAKRQKLIEDVRTIGLPLDDWKKIGCVNHDCDRCKAAAQRPVAEPHKWVNATTWRGLTDEEIEKNRHLIDWTAHWSYGTFTRAIEAKLKEKNT